MIPLKIRYLITVVICFVVTRAYSQSPALMPPRDSALILHNIISYHIRYAVEGDLSVGSNGLLDAHPKSIFQKLMPVDGQLETEVMPCNDALSYPDKDYQLFTVHLPGFKTIYPNGMSTTVRLLSFRFDDYYLVAYNTKNATIKYISGNFFKSPITQDFELNNNRPESFFPYLKLRCYAMQPGHISFQRKDEKGLYFTVYSNSLHIDVEVFIRYDDHEVVKVTDNRSTGNVLHTGTKFQITNIDSLQQVYVFYATRNDSTIKIVSKKEHPNNCQPVLVGQFYDLNITSLLGKTASKLHIGGVKYNDQLIKLEGGKVLWDLFTSDNLKGLCYTP